MFGNTAAIYEQSALNAASLEQYSSKKLSQTPSDGQYSLARDPLPSPATFWPGAYTVTPYGFQRQPPLPGHSDEQNQSIGSSPDSNYRQYRFALAQLRSPSTMFHASFEEGRAVSQYQHSMFHAYDNSSMRNFTPHMPSDQVQITTNIPQVYYSHYTKPGYHESYDYILPKSVPHDNDFEISRFASAITYDPAFAYTGGQFSGDWFSSSTYEDATHFHILQESTDTLATVVSNLLTSNTCKENPFGNNQKLPGRVTHRPRKKRAVEAVEGAMAVTVENKDASETLIVKLKIPRLGELKLRKTCRTAQMAKFAPAHIQHLQVSGIPFPDQSGLVWDPIASTGLPRCFDWSKVGFIEISLDELAAFGPGHSICHNYSDRFFLAGFSPAEEAGMINYYRGLSKADAVKRSTIHRQQNKADWTFRKEVYNHKTNRRPHPLKRVTVPCLTTAGWALSPNIFKWEQENPLGDYPVLALKEGLARYPEGDMEWGITRVVKHAVKNDATALMMSGIPEYMQKHGIGHGPRPTTGHADHLSLKKFRERVSRERRASRKSQAAELDEY